MDRLLTAELLDQLPAADPEAMGSRRDLRRLNILMGHAGLVARELQTAFRQERPSSLIEIGAGDGTFLLAVARRLASPGAGVKVCLLDKQPTIHQATLNRFKAFGWRVEVITADVFDWLAGDPERVDAVIANLFLHHFSEAQLVNLFRDIAVRTKSFVAAEPRRAVLGLNLSRLVGVLGCNRVTRHDVVASVRAGFAGCELSRVWPDNPKWQLHERPAGLFSHLFCARLKR